MGCSASKDSKGKSSSRRHNVDSERSRSERRGRGDRHGRHEHGHRRRRHRDDDEIRKEVKRQKPVLAERDDHVRAQQARRPQRARDEWSPESSDGAETLVWGAASTVPVKLDPKPSKPKHTSERRRSERSRLRNGNVPADRAQERDLRNDQAAQPGPSAAPRNNAKFAAPKRNRYEFRDSMDTAVPEDAARVKRERIASLAALEGHDQRPSTRRNTTRVKDEDRREKKGRRH